MTAIEVLKRGGTLLYPTDTVWGLGCDATNAQAIEKVMSIKGRDRTKSLLILVKDLNMLRDYVFDVPQQAFELMKRIKEPLTIIYPQAKNLPDNLISQNGSIGIRIPQHDYCQWLLQNLGKPIVSTSANVSGKSSPASFEDIDRKIKGKVDFIAPIDNDKTTTHDLASAIYLITTKGDVSRIR
ncbi:MAG: threonylcarbamoyl-AMP synthase [Bacteroidales bacterium]|nr:threonylcarbamoyl-AMP synthase [Bacteroidales bacterium]